MTEAIFLYASNIHVTSKQRTEFTLLTIDTLEKITRGAGDKLNVDQQHIEKINRMSNSPNHCYFVHRSRNLKRRGNKEDSESRRR